MRDPSRRRTRRAPALSLIICIVLLADGGRPGVAGAPAQPRFERHEVVTGSANRQSVLTGFLLGGPVAELIIVEIDANKDRRLRIHSFEGGAWSPKLEATLRPQVVFVDVANIGGRDRLITYEPGRLHRFDPEAGTERALVAATSNFKPPREDEIPHVDVTRDVNGNGRDDLVVPEIDGFWIFVQRDDGAFAEPVKIGPPTDMSRILGADGYRYDPWSQSRIHAMDYDQDGRDDLVYWNESHFVVHRQNERGLFAPVPNTFTTDVAFDSDDPCSLATGDMTGRVLHSLTDLNGDGFADLVVHSLQGMRVSRKRSAYEVHFGARSAEGDTAFDSKVGVAFRSDGRILLGMDRLGPDRDGQVTLMLRTIEVKFLKGSFWKRLKGAMGDDVAMNLEFYRTADGLYSNKPNAVFRIALDGAPSPREPGWVPLDLVLRGATHERHREEQVWPRAFNRTLLIGDVTGDGRPDLLIEPEFRELHVFAGAAGPGLFAQPPEKVAVSLHDAEYAWLVDLNRDGKQDILVHHPFTLRDSHGAPKLPPGTEPHRVTLLIAK